MRRLMILRHAKSGYPDGVEDHERPLAPRGREAAPRMAAYMAGELLLPDAAVVSTALRTRQTFALVSAALGAPSHRFERRIYEAPSDQLMRVVGETDSSVRTLLLVGHNPGCAELAARLTGFGDRYAFARMTTKFPTCGLAVLDLDLADWSEITDRCGRLDRFVTPASIGDPPDD
jgi:phosphohistidine phosphatase